MLNPTANLLAALAFVIMAHLAASAACGHLLGFKLRFIRFGYGPDIIGRGVVRLAWIPLGGSVQFAALADFAPATPDPRSYELQPGWKRLLLPLSGPAALLGFGALFLGAIAIDSFMEGFWQILGGAASPFHDAQLLLRRADALLTTVGTGTATGLLACKMAALNLIPSLGANGLQALLSLFPDQVMKDGSLRKGIALPTAALALLIWGGWGMALIHFAAIRN